MTGQTNPRKLTSSGGMTVVSLPSDLLDEAGLQKGDRLVLEATETGFRAEKVEWQVSTDE